MEGTDDFKDQTVEEAFSMETYPRRRRFMLSTSGSQSDEEEGSRGSLRGSQVSSGQAVVLGCSSLTILDRQRMRVQNV